MRTFLQFRRSLFFTCSFFLWSFVYENKKQRKINFWEPLDRPCTIKEPLGDSWYQVLRNKKVFGRGGCLHSALVISAFFFFVLFLEFLLREQNKKQREINFSESLDMPRYIIYKVSPGVLQNIKVLHQGAYLPPALVISALSFFVFLLEFLLREQKATKDQFLRTAWYATIIKSQYLGFTKQKRFCNNGVPSSSSGDFCFFLFRFSLGVSSKRTKSNERSISHNRFICHH